MRLLVTGAAGFIGSNFVRYWLGQRPEDHVVAYDLLPYAGGRQDVPPAVAVLPGGIPDLQFPEKVIPLFTTHALDDQPLPLYASTQNKREWLHVLDHCRAIELVLEQGEPGETYNVGSGVERSIEEVADAVLEQTGKDASLKTIVPDRPGHDRRYLLDSSKIRALGWSEEIGWDEGIAETVRWYADNRDWWEPLRDRAPVDEAAWR